MECGGPRSPLTFPVRPGLRNPEVHIRWTKHSRFRAAAASHPQRRERPQYNRATQMVGRCLQEKACR